MQGPLITDSADGRLVRYTRRPGSHTSVSTDLSRFSSGYTPLKHAVEK